MSFTSIIIRYNTQKSSPIGHKMFRIPQRESCRIVCLIVTQTKIKLKISGFHRIPKGKSTEFFYLACQELKTAFLLLSYYLRLSFLFFIDFLKNNLYIQYAARTHDPQIKRCVLYWLSQPGKPLD